MLCLVISPLPSLLLPPIDNNATWFRRCNTNGTLCLTVQPFESTLVVLKKVFERMETPAVVLMQPLFLLLAVPAFIWVGVLGQSLSTWISFSAGTSKVVHLSMSWEFLC
ncbi:hypothetical protein BGY98DRAFT_1095070 [Russula aff. rugulosa BPL654]|nr:hypothetical protein BGY98DRAFT_1095070 [Russula aff. rugulosa BPL654]